MDTICQWVYSSFTCIRAPPNFYLIVCTWILRTICRMIWPAVVALGNLVSLFSIMMLHSTKLFRMSHFTFEINSSTSPNRVHVLPYAIRASSLAFSRFRRAFCGKFICRFAWASFRRSNTFCGCEQSLKVQRSTLPIVIVCANVREFLVSLNYLHVIRMQHLWLKLQYFPKSRLCSLL